MGTRRRRASPRPRLGLASVVDPLVAFLTALIVLVVPFSAPLDPPGPTVALATVLGLSAWAAGAASYPPGGGVSPKGKGAAAAAAGLNAAPLGAVDWSRFGRALLVDGPASEREGAALGAVHGALLGCIVGESMRWIGGGRRCGPCGGGSGGGGGGGPGRSCHRPPLPRTPLIPPRSGADGP